MDEERARDQGGEIVIELWGLAPFFSLPLATDRRGKEFGTRDVPDDRPIDALHVHFLELQPSGVTGRGHNPFAPFGPTNRDGLFLLLSVVVAEGSIGSPVAGVGAELAKV